MIKCWYYDVTPLPDPEKFRAGLLSLPWSARREKINRLSYRETGLLPLGAGLLLRHALEDAGAEDMTLSENEHGKPYLKNRPDICFNLSHSGSIALCAVSDAPVGADVEKLRDFNEKIARRFFAPEETEWIMAQADRGAAYTRLWTRKESYYKMLGTGITLPMDDFPLIPGIKADFVFTEKELPGHRLCVCGGGEAVFEEWK